jgi:hypothetical protein
LLNKGNNTHCYFCGICSTNPYHFQEVQGPDKYIIRTGLLSGADKMPVAAEIFGKDRWPFQKEIAETFEVAP